MIDHPISPVYNSESKILILGSFPSVKSRECGFFYGHPQNRFWDVVAEIFNRKKPESIEEKKQFLIECRIALWDVIASCNIKGSSDSSIRNAVANDIGKILSESNIKTIFVNGKTAEKLYNSHIFNKTLVPAVYLPSTSPANAAWSKEKLICEWAIVRKYTEI